jgi:serine protease AprX
MQPNPDVDPDELATARREVRRALGSELAAKGSDAFCLATVRRNSGRAPAFGLEAVVPAAAGAPVPAVVEFVEAASVPQVPRLTERDDWPQLVDTVASLDADLPAGALMRVSAALRQALAASVRNDGYRVLSPVYDEVERLSGSPLRSRSEVLGAPQIPSAVTQICWLNRTLRTWAGPEALAEVAGANAVTLVDVPRRIMPDANTRNHVAVGLPAFLRTSNFTGDGVTVAVIDSEVALAHPALEGRVVHRRNYTPEPWGNPDVHGTAVAGIIGGDNAERGGIAPGTVIYNYKVMATNRFLNGDDFGGALAIQQALEDGVDIANCSWGAGPVGPTLSREARAADTAWALGLAIVKSAGNLGPRNASMTTPADAAGIIVVGATDLDGRELQSYSSRGPAAAKPGPDVLAPGGGAAGALDCCLVTGGFGDAGFGTSYAAPHVSGLLALLLQREPQLVPDQLRERLRAAARLLPELGADAQGSGLIQAA